MSPAPELEGLWRDSSARLSAWFERETRNAADAEDLVQETFVRVHERLDTLVDAASVRAWVGRIARNVLVDHLRRRGRAGEPLPAEGAPLQDERDELAERADDPDPSLERTVASWLEDFLAELEPEDAAALRWVDLEGRTQAELAARTGLSLSGAKSRVQRAREKLRARLEACCTFAFDARGGIMEARRRAAGRCSDGCGGDCAV
ncbi:MAG: sigma-70 family RNA polymerase sigma factor [Planctomycetes bacterium]|nr:sigma-70 family RNA polymerase sigma factor [Planctomycetota bacterium]